MDGVAERPEQHPAIATVQPTWKRGSTNALI